MPGSITARLSAGLHVCLFARWPACLNGQSTAWPLDCPPVCNSGSLSAFAVAGSVGRDHGHYHPSVKTIKRSAGRAATAAAAYRSASVIACDREGRMHDYTAKCGVEACFILDGSLG